MREQDKSGTKAQEKKFMKTAKYTQDYKINADIL